MARIAERFKIGANIDDTSGDLIFRTWDDEDCALYVNVWRQSRRQARVATAHTSESWSGQARQVPAPRYVYAMEFDGCVGDWPCFATINDAVKVARTWYSN